MASTAIAFGQTGIEKLKGAENYSTWKFTMRMLLIHEELWNCVEAEPSEDGDKKKVDKALARIALSVTPAVIPYIRTAKSAHEAWKILQKAYEGRGLSRRLGLLRSLFSTKLSENSSMEVYLNKIKEISHQLHEIESPLDDEFVAVIMLSGLTDDYDPLIMAIEHSTSKLSTEIISQKWLQETQRLEEKTEETALITQKQPKVRITEGYSSPDLCLKLDLSWDFILERSSSIDSVIIVQPSVDLILDHYSVVDYNLSRDLICDHASVVDTALEQRFPCQFWV